MECGGKRSATRPLVLSGLANFERPGRTLTALAEEKNLVRSETLARNR